ncbi:MAG TPA: response regulator, partial [Gemmatimonadaceae bacterium]|nr:response regulator [Gemmatimonadaceae bacterium]
RLLLDLHSTCPVSFYSMSETTQAGAGKTVLVVDDHDTTRLTIARMLEAGGFVVEQASSGLEALSHLAVHGDAIDMVLSDVTMPGMSGIDLSYQIRELYPNIPVAIVSGDVSELERSIIGRADVPFIKKPFHAESLYSAVRDAIRQASSS